MKSVCNMKIQITLFLNYMDNLFFYIFSCTCSYPYPKDNIIVYCKTYPIYVYIAT